MSLRKSLATIALLFGVLTTETLHAQAPTTMVYQGRLTTTAGVPLTGNQSVTFRLYASASSGTEVWTETHNLLLDESGVFTIELGLSDPLDESVFDGTKRYLGMTLAGGTEMLPRQLISSAAYSVSAKNALIDDGAVTATKLADGAVLPVKLGDGAVVAPKLADGAVTTPKIANAAVSADKIAGDAVASANIVDGTITTADIATDGVGFEEIQYKSVSGDHLWDNVLIGAPLPGETEGGPGYLGISNAPGVPVIEFGVGESGEGVLLTYDQNGDITAGIDGGAGEVGGNDLVAYNFDGLPTAGIDGEAGEVWGLVKSFIVADPTQSDRLIRYSSIEGPEAAIYCRGQVELVGGRANIAFPEHFSSMAAPGTVTVSLTPRSLDSKGLAALDVSPAGMTVGELAGGNGTYTVDYVAYAVRIGHEDFEVYRNRADHEAAVGRLTAPPKRENKGTTK